MDRRELIQWLVATAGLPALDGLAPADLFALGRDIHRDTTPHAAGRTLTAPAERERFLAGLQDLDARCRARASRDFVACSEADQVAVLTALDAAHEEWFDRLKYLTVYGYCTSEVGMRTLGLFPLPWRYDGCAPVDATH